jgi:hypothetical protein
MKEGSVIFENKIIGYEKMNISRSGSGEKVERLL